MEPCLSASGTGYRLNGFLVNGSRAQGVVVHDGAFVEIEDVTSQNTTGTCLLIQSVWNISVRDVRLNFCGWHGLEAQGYTTTLQAERVFADHPAGHGFFLNRITYSTFQTVAVDFAGGYGYWLQNVSGVSFVSPGSEYSASGMFAIVASNAEAIGPVKDIQGVVIIAPFSYGNGGATSTFDIRSLDGRVIDVTIIGGMEHYSPSGKTAIMQGTGTRVSRTGGVWKGTFTAKTGAVFQGLF